MCEGKKCLGKNETNKLNFLERKWHRKSDIMNARRWDLFQFAYFTTNLCTSPPWQMREDRRLIFIPELWKRNKEKFQSITLKKLRSLLKGAVSRLPNSFCFLCPNAIHASLFAMKLEKIPVNDKICLPNIISMVTRNKNELWKTVRWTSFQKPQLQAFFFKFFHPCHLQYLRCHLHLLQTFRAVMHQSIPAATSQPPPPPTPRLLWGIYLPFQSRGWGICNFCSARGPCFCQPQGYSRALDTHAVRICSLFSSPPRVIWQLKSPHPREFATKPKKKIAHARESAGGGVGGGGWVLGWGRLGAAGIDWCNILMIHSISVVAIRTVWVLILNFVTHLL